MNTTKRDTSIDNYKGILVVLMVLAHIIQFFPLNLLTNIFSQYVNLTTFSGFMFCFGFVCYKAYINRHYNKSTFLKKMIKNFIRTIIAYYISAIGYCVFVENAFNFKNLIKIIFLWKIEGYSEFLLSFAFIYIVLYFINDYLIKVEKTKLIILVLFSLLSTFLSIFNFEIPILGVLVGEVELCIISASSVFIIFFDRLLFFKK